MKKKISIVCIIQLTKHGYHFIKPFYRSMSSVRENLDNDSCIIRISLKFTNLIISESAQRKRRCFQLSTSDLIKSS